MAVATFTLTIYEGVLTKTVIINQPSSAILSGLEYSNSNTDLTMVFKDFGSVQCKFPSSVLRSNFVTDLIAGFEAGTTFALDNQHPIATTTTTTTAP